jgi:DNA-binding IclR family transcriptional regulator
LDLKYNVPALERANAVLSLLSQDPYRWKLSDLSKELGISKSTLYSLLVTMERLKWINRDRNDAYAIGSTMGQFGSAFFRQYDLIEDFQRLADPIMRRLQESIQLAILDGSDVLYLAKVEASSPVQMVSGPGVRFPAHATGLGKSLLTGFNEEQIRSLFPQEKLSRVTVHTIVSRETLIEEVIAGRQAGYTNDIQEGVMGFCCVAAPIRRPNGNIAAAVSCSMPIHHWEGKKDQALHEVIELAKLLSPAH